MARLLLLETATNVCSVGLSEDNRMVVSRTATEDYAHARLLTTLIEECRQEAGWAFAQLDAIAVSSGPGSFTSLRVGTATAKGLCYALNIPLISVDTLASLADGVRMSTPRIEEDALIFSALDARRKEVYISIFNADGKPVRPLAAEVLGEQSFADLRAGGSHMYAAGNGAPKLIELLQDAHLVDTQVRCAATHIMNCAHLAFDRQAYVDTAYYEPVYLKPPHITKARKRL